MNPRSQESSSKTRANKKRHRLDCPNGRLEIEIINPCARFSTGQLLRCCGRHMTLEVGVSVDLEFES
jgi:hypothetical protein